MTRFWKCAALACAIVAQCQYARAGVYADDLGKCLVKSSSTDDQIALVQWIYSAMSAHPAVKPYSNFTPEQIDAVTRKGSGLFERLLTVDCRAEAVAALKYEGPSALESGFSLLGQIAMRNLMSEPHVVQNLANLGKDADAAKMNALFAEAGLATTPPQH